MSCITLLSDFGRHDSSVAITRGVLLQHVTGVPIVDISHDATPYHAAEAAYLLASARASFPPGTVHLCLTDIFSERNARLVLAEHDGHYFLAPDNGLLPAALGTVPRAWLCLELPHDGYFADWLHAAGRTIQLLITEEGMPKDLPETALKPARTTGPQITDDGIECEVVHIDRYENVVTNMTRGLFDELRGGRRFRIRFMLVEEITELSTYYQDVREGFKLCRFNSTGHLEICINRGPAASLFGLRLGSRHNDIKIFFE
jgi:S-adenosyl-L-methionine hydrolase (adenosine-forming)